MTDIIERLRIESRREPHEPIWRDAIDEIEALRAEVAEWKRVSAAQGESKARAERLAEALRELEGRAQRDEDLMQQALEALEVSTRFVYADMRPQCEDAIAALRKRLASGHECAAAIRAMKEQL